MCFGRHVDLVLNRGKKWTWHAFRQCLSHVLKQASTCLIGVQSDFDLAKVFIVHFIKYGMIKHGSIGNENIK